MKFQRKGATDKAAKKGHVSPMQKKGWAQDTSLREATTLLQEHIAKGAAWSGDSLLYLNALWDAAQEVARAEGFVDEE